jgi:hypothetical protein
MDDMLHRSPRSTNLARVALLALALLVAAAGRVAADPATPVPTLATSGPIGVGSVVSWNDPAPQPGYALVGAGGGDEYTCPASYAGGTIDDDPDTVAVCNHRGFGGEYTVLARDAGMNLFYVRNAAPTPFVAGGCCVYYWSAPVLIPATPAVTTPTGPTTTTSDPAPVAAPAPAPVTTTTPAPVVPPTTPVPAAHAVTIGPGTLTPASLTLTAAQNPALVLSCSAACTATLTTRLQLGSARTTLKTLMAKLAAGHHQRLTIHLSTAQHRAIRKALAAHKPARVVTAIRIQGQAHGGQVAFAYHR